MEKNQIKVPEKAKPKATSEVKPKAKPKAKPKTAPKKPSVSKAKSKALVARKPSAVDKPMNLEVLIGKAITKGNLDVVERLLAVRKQLKDEFAEEQFYIAMAGFQRDCPTIERKKPVYQTTKDSKGHSVLLKDEEGNLVVRFHYAPAGDIQEAVRGYLEKWGFSYTFKEEDLPDHVKVTGFVHHKMGYTEANTVAMPIDAKAYMNDPQKVASARMYALRYAFCNGFGILTADRDDAGEGAGEIKGQTSTVPNVTSSETTSVETVPLNTLCDRILDKLRSGVFSKEEHFTLENRLMEIHKQANVKAMVAFEENIDRQIKFKRRQQDGSSEGS